jgi:5,10-methylenetetrahydromethanopterin reductase
MDRWGLSMGVSPREPLKNVTDLAAAADAKGFEAMWFIDFQLGMKDVYAAMNLAALASENLHIGSAVTNLITRHPTVTANATAALDELSGGKAMLGLGAGWSAVYGAGGQPSKLGDLSAGIDEFRKLFTGEEQELYGTKVKLAAATRQIPIYLAVSQPGMLRLSGEKCDGAILMGAADPEFCEWQLKYIHEGLEKAGRDRSEVVVDLVVTMSVDDDEEKALSDVRAWATSQAATFDVWKHMPPAWERFRPEFAAANSGYHLVEHLSLHAGHKQVVSDEFVRSVALAGTKEQCVARLKELAALDIDRITFALLSGGRKRRLEQLADEIIPAVNA